MKLAHPVLAIALLLALAPTAARAQANNDCQPASPLVKWCPPNPTDSTLITFYYNASLDGALETAFGNAATRTTAVSQAVQDWNDALVGVGAKVRITFNPDPNRWAIDQGSVKCVDQIDPNASVFIPDPGTHIPNNETAASTGHNHGGAHLDMNLNPIGAGWIVPFNSLVSDTTVFDVDAVLGITVTQLNGNCITEGDIWWLTHYKMFGVNPCLRISWDYRYPLGPDAARFDYYSVMLHELGHLLGLGHQDADPTGNNVMQAFIGKGKRRVIGPKEKACLCQLYGGPGCTPTPAHHSSWGQIKTRYH